jgi:hypothetical protein
MPKKSAPDDTSPPLDTPEFITDPSEIEIPQSVIDIFGGRPIPAPPVPRPSVNRVGSPMSALYSDPRGLLAGRRPDRRAALAKIDRARSELSGLVTSINKGIAKVRSATTAAGADAETCALEQFDPAAVETVVAELEAVLKNHLG